jgi:hypothetical protein
MADFQSFLLQNMQLIGLEDEEDDENDAKTSTNTKTTKSSQLSSTNSKFSTRESICIKSPARKDKIPKKKSSITNGLANPSIATTETFLSSSNLNNNGESSKSRDNFIDEPKVFKKQYNYNDDNDNASNASSFKISKKKTPILDDSNDYHLKSVGLFKRDTNNSKEDNKKAQMNLKKKNSINIYDYDDDSSASNSSDRELSSPESILVKNDFKSSTPIVVGGDTVTEKLRSSRCQESFKNNNYERVIKSPKPLKSNAKKQQQQLRNKTSSNESLDYRRVSSQRNKKKQRQTILNASTSCESITNHMQTSFVALNSLNDLNNEEYDNENNNQNYSDERSIESTLMEPFLVKFERELLKSSKSDMIKDFKNFKQQNVEALTSKLKKQISDSKRGDPSTASGHLFQRYLKEIKNLTVRKKEGRRKDENQSSTVKVAKLRPSLNLLELRKMSKNQIPWNNLDIESADMLLGCIRVDESDDSNEDTIFPDLYSKNGNKISKNQVKRWYEILKSLKDEMCASLNNSIEKSHGGGGGSVGVVSSPVKLNSSKKFFMNKKRQIMDKVVLARKKSSTPKTSTQKITKVADEFVYSNFEEISHSVSKLYANDQIEKTKTRQTKQRNANKNDSNNSAASSMLSYSSSSSSNSESESSNKTELGNEEISQYVNENFNLRSIETGRVNNEPKVRERPKVPPKIPPPPVIRPNANDPNNFYNEIDSALHGIEPKSTTKQAQLNANNPKIKKTRETLSKATTQSASAMELANKEIKIKESKQIFEKFFEALEQEQEAIVANNNNKVQKNSKTNLNKETNLTTSKTSMSKLTHSNSAVSVVPPLPEFSDGFAAKNGISSVSKAQLNSLVKLKGNF